MTLLEKSDIDELVEWRGRTTGELEKGFSGDQSDIMIPVEATESQLDDCSTVKPRLGMMAGRGTRAPPRLAGSEGSACAEDATETRAKAKSWKAIEKSIDRQDEDTK